MPNRRTHKTLIGEGADEEEEQEINEKCKKRQHKKRQHTARNLEKIETLPHTKKCQDEVRTHDLSLTLVAQHLRDAVVMIVATHSKCWDLICVGLFNYNN